jgi:hypothetical protein
MQYLDLSQFWLLPLYRAVLICDQPIFAIPKLDDLKSSKQNDDYGSGYRLWHIILRELESYNLYPQLFQSQVTASH